MLGATTTSISRTLFYQLSENATNETQGAKNAPNGIFSLGHAHQSEMIKPTTCSELFFRAVPIVI